ncbi:hypothetical protein PO909_027543, partial [Leuciscus waleckii]
LCITFTFRACSVVQPTSSHYSLRFQESGDPPGPADLDRRPVCLSVTRPKTFQTGETKKVISLTYRAAYRPQKMSSVQFLRLFVTPLSKMNIVTSVSIIFLLVGLQAIMDVKFSCPCRVGRNQALTSCILFAPAIFALLIMLLLLRSYKNESSLCSSQGKDSSGTSQGKDSSGTSQGKDSSGTSQGKDSSGTSQGKDSSGTSQGKESSGTSQGKDSSGTSQSEKKLSWDKAFVVCITCLVWICIFFIDGDYLACGLTNWNGHYACDNELHPRCVNWCKPTKLSRGQNETECYEKTLEFIWISKITGYGLAVIFCIIAVIFVTCFDCCKSQESQEQQGPGNEEQPEQRTDNLPMRGSATAEKGEQGPESPNSDRQL